LIQPHGGSLVNRIIAKSDVQELSKLPILEVDEKVVLDCEQIATGVYSPLQGFMTKEQVEDVLNNNSLPDGSIWTLPIILPVRGSAIKNLQKGDFVALKNTLSGELFALLHIEEVFPLQFESVTTRMFGTNSLEHPGVKQLKNSGDMLLGGKIELAKFSSKSKKILPFIFTPQNTRMIFEQKNWYRVAGFHTRNIVHSGHEYVHKKALDEHFCDGLFISPEMGSKEKRDFKSELVLMGYQRMIELNIYPKNRVMIGAFFPFPRHGGPREAVFMAICSKNYGCSHYILGRDHTEINNFYKEEANMRFFEEVGDIGIKSIFFDETAYCNKCESMRLSCEHPSSCIHPVNGTTIKEYLNKNEKPPNWMIREEIGNMLINMLNR
jgi:ATP sulfurylase